MAVDFWLQRLESNQHNTAYEAVETPFLNSAVTSASILHREHRPYKTDVSIQDTSFCGLGSLETHGAAHRSRTCRSLRFAPDCLTASCHPVCPAGRQIELKGIAPMKRRSEARTCRTDAGQLCTEKLVCMLPLLFYSLSISQMWCDIQ